jgi:hypothetical protein
MDNEEYIMKKLENLDERIRVIEINYASLMGKVFGIVTVSGLVAHFVVSVIAKFIVGK